MLKEPNKVIDSLIKEKYKEAKAVFWAGSVSKNDGTSASDLDLVIVYESIPTAYREAFIYDTWPIDAFVHDINTLQYFFEESRVGNGISGLMNMIINGIIVTEPSTFSDDIKTLAQEILNVGPIPLTQDQIDKERFLITDILDDIKFPRNKNEQIASAVHLFEPLIQFYFRAQKKWSGSGKALMRLFKLENPYLAQEWNKAFETLVKVGDASGIETVVTKILIEYGGLLWDGFRSYSSSVASKKNF